MPSLFLCYSRNDSVIMRTLAANLSQARFVVWIDEDMIPVGTPDWKTAIEQAVQRVDAMVVILSPAAKDSEWVNYEIGLARKYDKPIFPVLIFGDELTAIPDSLNNAQYADMRGRADYEAGLRKLVTGLAAHLHLAMSWSGYDPSGQPRVQLNVYGHNSGTIVVVGGDVHGEMSVAGRDIVKKQSPPMRVKPQAGVARPSATRRPKQTEAAAKRQPTPIGWAGIVTWLGTIIGIVAGVIALVQFGQQIVNGSPVPSKTPAVTTMVIASTAASVSTPIAPTDTPAPTDIPRASDTPAPTATATPLGGGNGRIVFQSDRNDHTSEIYVMDADGARVSRLTNSHQTGLNLDPAWSPDRSRIAFDTFSAGARLKIYVMNADGSAVSDLSDTTTGQDLMPAWSPDGTRIAFHSNRDGNFEVYVMLADGSGHTNLSHNVAADISPAWSPDGERIAFVSDRDGNAEIYVMAADGSNQTRLTDNLAEDSYPAWSPDGAHIVFASNRDRNFEIYVMNADGSGQTRLTDNPAEDDAPVWSADGSRILFASVRDDPKSATCTYPCNYEIYMMHTDGSDVTRLTNNLAVDAEPDW